MRTTLTHANGGTDTVNAGIDSTSGMAIQHSASARSVGRLDSPAGLRSTPRRGSKRRHRQPSGRLPRSSDLTEQSQSGSSTTEDTRTCIAVPQPARMKSFQIGDSAKTKEFLCERLAKLQQVSCKKLAKTWIRGICPKKQARFPYANARRFNFERKQPEVPLWWPSLDKCRYSEPDHIRRNGK